MMSKIGKDIVFNVEGKEIARSELHKADLNEKEFDKATAKRSDDFPLSHEIEVFEETVQTSIVYMQYTGGTVIRSVTTNESGDVVGFGTMWPPEHYKDDYEEPTAVLTDLWVSPIYQRQGLGSFLIAARIAVAIEMFGAEDILAYAAKGSPAYKLLKSKGFNDWDGEMIEGQQWMIKRL